MNAMQFAAGSALAAWAGMAALCFQSSSQRHRMGLREQTRGQQQRFIAAGSALLAISLAAAIAADGVSFGIVLWLCQAGILGAALICWLPYSMTGVVTSARCAAATAPLLLAAGNWW
ncbi:MAG TPA: DUF3325 family protein [Noviherbaspirillum sp.]|nr:DUF3325 family protein [Noviherbaspirillum sp.]